MNADVTGTFVFLSTPSARRATGAAGQYAQCPEHFYPRPPRGGRPAQVTSEGLRMLFLSTPSARRATRQTQTVAQASSYFYPRPPRGGRPPQLDQSYLASSISIHALREEGDQILQRDDGVVCTISIHALREEGDQPPRIRGSRPRISIHALREEGDHPGYNIGELLGNFYPRPPRGGRLL